MITPLDIQNKEFAKGVRGYKEDDVDGFLDLLTLDMEKLLEENKKLKDQIHALNNELLRYKSTEGTVLETLEAAKSLMGDISASAEKRAEILVKNAELDAKMITREARESAERLTEENNALRNRYMQFRSRFKNMLEMELERFDTLSEDIFEEKDIADLENILDEAVSVREDDPSAVGGDERKTIVNMRVGEKG